MGVLKKSGVERYLQLSFKSVSEYLKAKNKKNR